MPLLITLKRQHHDYPSVCDSGSNGDGNKSLYGSCLNWTSFVFHQLNEGRLKQRWRADYKRGGVWSVSARASSPRLAFRGGWQGIPTTVNKCWSPKHRFTGPRFCKHQNPLSICPATSPQRQFETTQPKTSIILTEAIDLAARWQWSKHNHSGGFLIEAKCYDINNAYFLFVSDSSNDISNSENRPMRSGLIMYILSACYSSTYKSNKLCTNQFQAPSSFLPITSHGYI